MIKKGPFIKMLKTTLKTMLWCVGFLVTLSLGLSLLLLIPKVQLFAVKKTTQLLNEKTGLNTSVGSVHITFPKTIKIGGISIESHQNDTIFYCRKISANAAILPLIWKKVDIGNISINGLKASIIQHNDSSYNFTPLIDAFVSKDSLPGNTADKAWQIGLDKVKLADFKIDYFNELDTSDYQLDLGVLEIGVNTIDLFKPYIDLDYIKLLNTSISLNMGKQTKNIQNPENTSNITLPFDLALNELKVENFHIAMNDMAGDVKLLVDLRNLDIYPHTIGLTNSTIALDELKVDGLNVLVFLTQDSVEQNTDKPAKISELKSLPTNTFGNFAWDVFVDRMAITQSNFKLDLNHNQDATAGIDYAHLSLSDIQLSTDSLFFNKQRSGFNVRELKLKEFSGPELKHLSGKFFLDNSHLTAENIVFATGRSKLEGSLLLRFPGLGNLTTDLGKMEIKSFLKGNIFINEIQPFYDLNTRYPSLSALQNIDINELVASGFLNDFAIGRAAFTLGDSCYIDARGHITGLPDSISKIDFAIDTLWANGSLLQRVLPDSLLPQSLHLPEMISLKSSGKTDMKTGDLDAEMTTSFGDARIKVGLKENMVTADVDISCFDLGSMLSIDMLGEVVVKGYFEGNLAHDGLEGFEMPIEVTSMDINKKTILDTHIKLIGKGKKYGIKSIFNDEALRGVFNASINLGDSINHLQADTDIDHADLLALHLTNQEFSLSCTARIDTDFKSMEEISATYVINKLKLNKPGKSFQIDEISVLADLNPKSTLFELKSDIVDASLSGNTKSSELKSAFLHHMSHYVSLPDSLLSEKANDFNFDLRLKDAGFFTTFLFTDLHELSLEQCHASYNQRTDLFEASLKMPTIKYSNLGFEDIDFSAHSAKGKTISLMHIGQLTLDSAVIKNIDFETLIQEQYAKLQLSIYDGADSLKYKLGAELSQIDSTYLITLSNEAIIDYSPWLIDPGNSLQLLPGKVVTKETKISYEDQKLWIESNDSTLRLNIENFKLQNVSGLLDKEKVDRQLKGKVNGYLEINGLFGEPWLQSQLSFDQLLLQNVAIGMLNTSFTYHKNTDLDFDAELKNEMNSISLKGSYNNMKTGPYVNFNMETDIKNAQIFQPFASRYLTDIQGGFQGRLRFVGAPNKPTVNGNLTFNKLQLNPATLSSKLLNDGTITIEDNILNFKNYNITDSLNNHLNFAGTIDLLDINNLLFDMSISTRDFMLIDNYSAINKTIAGKLMMGADVNIKGSQKKPLIRSTISINKGTDMMYTLPGKDLELINSAGIVDFVDFKEADILEKEQAKQEFFDDSIASTISGIDFSTLIKIDPQAKFTINIDPNSGDITTFRLKGDLQYKFNDKQRGYLSGQLELEEGFYDLSFYGLVKKKFIYDKGSTLSWSGDAMDGNINFSARYIVKTNSVGLVSNEISSYETSAFNQRLPYEVILYVTNQISDPYISFGIELDEKQKSNNPIIDTKLKMLNMPTMEAERNKQVFALLVGGTFIAENPGGSGDEANRNFASTAARNSVNSIMTQQLNNLSGQYIKVVDVDMGLNTFDDYATGQTTTKTQLDVKVSKKLFHNRVSAELESHIDLDGSNPPSVNQSTSGMPEYAVSYNITEAGNYRIKAFRENAYDIFDGEIQNSGLAFIFFREFDSFKKKNKTNESIPKIKPN